MWKISPESLNKILIRYWAFWLLHGFDFADFELADRAALLKQYPQYAGLIETLTRI